MKKILIKETDKWFYYDRDDAQDSRNHNGKFIKGYWINANTGQRAVSNMTYNMGNTSAWKEEMRSFDDNLYDGWGTGPYCFETGLKQLMKLNKKTQVLEPQFDRQTGYPIIDSDCGKSTKKSPLTKKRLPGVQNANRRCDKFNSYSASDAREMVTLIEEAVRNSPPTDDDDDDSLFHNFKGPLKSETLI